MDQEPRSVAFFALVLVTHQCLHGVCCYDCIHLIHQSGEFLCAPEDIIQPGGKFTSHAEVMGTDEVASAVLASPVFACLPVSKM